MNQRQVIFRQVLTLLLLMATVGCKSLKVSSVPFDLCSKLATRPEVTPSPTNRELLRASNYRIGFGRYKANVPGNRHLSYRTLRAYLYSSKLDTLREVAPSLIDTVDSYTWFQGWSNDGTLAILDYRYETQENAEWEDTHSEFRFDPRHWRANNYLVNIGGNDAVEDPISVSRVSTYNVGLMFNPANANELMFTSLVGGRFVPYRMNRNGSGKEPLNDQGFTYGLSISPNGQKISYHSDYAIYVMNSDGSQKSEIRTGLEFNFGPLWSSDSKKISFIGGYRTNSVFVADVDSKKLMFVSDRGGYDGSAAMLDVRDFHGGSTDLQTWSTDGRWVYFTKNVGSSREIFRSDIDCNLEQLTHSGTPALRHHPLASPDGQFLVYTINSGGARDLAVLNLDSFEETRITSLPIGYGAAWPQWNPVVE